MSQENDVTYELPEEQINMEIECVQTQYLCNIKKLVQIEISILCSMYMEKVFEFFNNKEPKPTSTFGTALEVVKEQMEDSKIKQLTKESFDTMSDILNDILCCKMKAFLERCDGDIESIIMFSRECERLHEEAKSRTIEHVNTSLMLSIKFQKWPMKMLECFDWPMKDV